MSNVSSRVLNMKFMRKASQKSGKLEAKKEPPKNTSFQFKNTVDNVQKWANLLGENIEKRKQRLKQNGTDKSFAVVGYSQMKDFFESDEEEEEEEEYKGRRLYGGQIGGITETKMREGTSGVFREEKLDTDAILDEFMEESNKKQSQEFGTSHPENDDTETKKSKENDNKLIPSVEDFLNPKKRTAEEETGKKKKKRSRKGKK